MAKSNMTVSSGRGGSNTNTIQSLTTKQKNLAKKIDSMKSSPERDDLLSKYEIMSIEISHRKDFAIEYDTLLKNVSPEIRKTVENMNENLLKNDIKIENLKNERRKMSAERDNLREKRVDTELSYNSMSPSDTGYSAKKKELDSITSKIDSLTSKIEANNKESDSLMEESGDLRRKKNKYMYDNKL